MISLQAWWFRSVTHQYMNIYTYPSIHEHSHTRRCGADISGNGVSLGGELKVNLQDSCLEPLSSAGLARSPHGELWRCPGGSDRKSLLLLPGLQLEALPPSQAPPHASPR